MRRLFDEAYVLGTLELGEADLIVTLFAEHHGKVRAVAPSARTSRRRFGGALEPLTRVRAVWVEREGRDLHRLESLDCLRSFARMQSEPARQAACAVLAEISSTFAHEGQAEPPDFRLLGAVLEALEGGGDPWVLARYFEYWTLRLHGLLPDLEACAQCSRPLAPGGSTSVEANLGLLCSDCARGAGRFLRRFGPEECSFLGAASRLPPAQMPAQRGAAGPGRALELLLRGRLEAFAERSFRSYRHLASATLPEGGGPPWP